MLRSIASSCLPRTNISCLHFGSSHFPQLYSGLTPRKSSYSHPFAAQVLGSISGSYLSSQERRLHLLAMNTKLSLGRGELLVRVSSEKIRMRLKFNAPAQEKVPKVGRSAKHGSWKLGASTAAGLCLSFSTFSPVHAEASRGDDKRDYLTSSSNNTSHGKNVYTDYSITGIPGDGRCLFRSVAHGACLRSGKPVPNETLQRQLADELRSMVADELVKRRAETEWFIEGDFDTYVSQMRKPHVWGGEPELLMASHVLQMPITVYMHDEDSGGLITIAEYGQEYGTKDPIRVLYHGFGHYDALQIPGRKGAKSRL